MTKVRSSDGSMIDDRRGRSGGRGGGGGFPGLGGGGAGGFPFPMKAGGGLLGIIMVIVDRIASHEAIAKRAYEMFQSGPGGSSTEHWLRAERELLNM